MTFYWWSHWFWITSSLYVILLLLPNAITYVHTYPSQHEINLAYTKINEQADAKTSSQQQQQQQSQLHHRQSAAAAAAAATGITTTTTTTTTTKLYQTTASVAWATAAPLLEQNGGSNGANITDLTIKAASTTHRDSRELTPLTTEHKRSTEAQSAPPKRMATQDGHEEKQVAGAIEQQQDQDEDIVLEAETEAEASDVDVDVDDALASAIAPSDVFDSVAARHDLNNYTNFSGRANIKTADTATARTKTTTLAAEQGAAAASITAKNTTTAAAGITTTTTTITTTTIMSKMNKGKMLGEHAPSAELVSAAIASGSVHAAAGAAAAATTTGTTTTTTTITGRNGAEIVLANDGRSGGGSGGGGIGLVGATPATPHITLDQQQHADDTLVIGSEFDMSDIVAAAASNDLQKAPFTLENVNKEDELRRAEVEHRARKSKELSAEYKHLQRYINYSSDSKSLLTRSASTAPNEYETDEGNISSEALAIQRTYFLDAGTISAICFTVFGICCTVGTIGIVLYRRRYLNKPQALSEPDSSVYIDDSTMRDNSDEMYSLDNDSFLNSLEAMTIQNYWTDTVKHTKL